MANKPRNKTRDLECEHVSLCCTSLIFVRELERECSYHHPQPHQDLSLWLQWFKSIWLFLLLLHHFWIYYDFHEADVPISYERKKKNIFLFHLFNVIRHRPTEQHHSHTDFHDQWLRLGCGRRRRRRSNAYLVDLSVSLFCWLNRLRSRTEVRIHFIFVNGIESDYIETDTRYKQSIRTQNCVHGLKFNDRRAAMRRNAFIGAAGFGCLAISYVRSHLWRWFREESKPTIRQTIASDIFIFFGSHVELNGTTSSNPTPHPLATSIRRNKLCKL